MSLLAVADRAMRPGGEGDRRGGFGSDCYRSTASYVVFREEKTQQCIFEKSNLENFKTFQTFSFLKIQKHTTRVEIILAT